VVELLIGAESALNRNKMPGKVAETFLYFAFGSNMSSERIREKNPSAKFLKTARLTGYRFEYDGYSRKWEGSPATITRTNNHEDQVYGVLWELNQEHLQTLDQQEGVARDIYRRLTLTVEPCSAVQHSQNADKYEGAVKVVTYQMTPARIAKMKEEGLGDSRPSRAYKDVILKGAREHNLPQSYIDYLWNNFYITKFKAPTN